MSQVMLRSHIGADGVLKLEVPTELPEMDVEVTLTMNPVENESDEDAAVRNGWPPGFLEKAFGCLKDDPIERGPQGVFETREPLD